MLIVMNKSTSKTLSGRACKCTSMYDMMHGRPILFLSDEYCQHIRTWQLTLNLPFGMNGELHQKHRISVAQIRTLPVYTSRMLRLLLRAQS